LLSYLLYGLFITACLVLIVSVLLQPGKADAGSLFTSSVSSAAFGPRGTQTILSKITIGAAITFFLVALLLGFGLGGGQRSLMEGGVGAKPTPAASPAAPASSPAAPAQTDATPAAAPTQDGSAAPAASPAAPATPAASPASNASPAPK
jgi:preprotein translocase subunit SecG